MEPAQIREAARLVRTAWNQNNYVKGEALCTLGALAKVADPSLQDRGAMGMSHWQDVAFMTLMKDEHLRHALDKMLDLLFETVPCISTEMERKNEIGHQRIAQIHDPVERSATRLCLANLTRFRSGEDSAVFLEELADLRERAVV